MNAELIERMQNWMRNLVPMGSPEFAKDWEVAVGLIDEAISALSQAAGPVEMILFCPCCGLQHVDAPCEAQDWTNPPHRSHKCGRCGKIWRPADIATTGVAAITSAGSADNWPVLKAPTPDARHSMVLSQAAAVPDGMVMVPRKAVAEAITQLQRAQHRDAAEGLRIAYALTDLQTAVPEQQTAPKCETCGGATTIPDAASSSGKRVCPDCTKQQTAPGCVCGRPREPICNDTFNGAPGSDDDCGNIGPDENGKFYCGHSRACHDSGKGAR